MYFLLLWIGAHATASLTVRYRPLPSCATTTSTRVGLTPARRA